MDNVLCYNCGLANATEYAAENGYSLTKCSHCGLLYVNPRPGTEEIEQAHRLGQHRGAELIQTTGYYDFSKQSSYLTTLKDLFGDGSALQGKTWLDIGCGYGEFLLALKAFARNGLTLRGIEPNEHKAAAARKKGLDVGYFDLAGHTDKYDYVSFLNVYSHLPDPPGAMNGWRQLLRPGGHLLVETGDTADLPPEVHPRPLYLPDHLSFASERIVVGILERVGFEIIAVRKYPEVRETPSAILRELLKLFVPGKRSRIGRVIRRELRTMDMYILARLKPEHLSRRVGSS